jgi:hypothetical protein
MLAKIINRRLLAHRNTLYFFSKGTPTLMQTPSTNSIARKIPSPMTTPNPKKPRSLIPSEMRRVQGVGSRKNIRHLPNHNSTNRSNRKRDSAQQDFQDSVTGRPEVISQEGSRKKKSKIQRKAINLQ